MKQARLPQPLAIRTCRTHAGRMTEGFDKDYWESHWQATDAEPALAPHPYLAAETSTLIPGTALDAGCGEGAEAFWLAAAGWQVTAADISAVALARAAERASAAGDAGQRIEWIEADLTVWEPSTTYDLVTTHYAHSAMPQLTFYQRVAEWVGPGGTLLVVGHLQDEGHAHGHGHGHGEGHGDAHGPPAEATVTAARIVEPLDAARWDVVTADEHRRTMTGRDGQPIELFDVVVRAARR